MIKNPYPGKFIVFEGLDGSGLSTQAELLKDYLLKKGHQVFLTKEPFLKLVTGRKIERILNKEEKIAPGKLQKLYIQNRREHLKKDVIPRLKKGEIVISDRYFLSTLAYGRTTGLSEKELIKLNEGFLIPNITFLLKALPETCIKRIKKRGIKMTLFEKKEKLRNVWIFYEDSVKKFEDIKIINAEKSVSQVFNSIKKILSQLGF